MKILATVEDIKTHRAEALKTAIREGLIEAIQGFNHEMDEVDGLSLNVRYVQRRRDYEVDVVFSEAVDYSHIWYTDGGQFSVDVDELLAGDEKAVADLVGELALDIDEEYIEDNLAPKIELLAQREPIYSPSVSYGPDYICWDLLRDGKNGTLVLRHSSEIVDHVELDKPGREALDAIIDYATRQDVTQITRVLDLFFHKN